MSSAQVMTLLDIVQHGPSEKQEWSTATPDSAPGIMPRRPDMSQPGSETQTLTDGTPNSEEDSEFKLPDLASMLIVLLGNALTQVTFFIIVASASAYAEHLGGTATFSGLTIGIPTLFSGLALIPLVRIDQGNYRLPFNISYVAMVIGNILYALAYRTNFLYLILIGRIVTGFGFISFMYHKRYCSDPRIVGIRRRTTLASYLVIGQGLGFSAGPFFGGLLYRLGFSNRVFNGFSSPGWVMAGCWAAFGTASYFLLKDVSTPLRQTTLPSSRPPQPPSPQGTYPPPASAPSNYHEEGSRLTFRQWGVIITMMWYAMTCFFILGAWESNIPVYTAIIFNYSPYNAGNFIALGGITAFPFLLVNVWYSRRLQDRITLAIGSALGLAGLLIMLSTVRSNKVTFGSLYMCWFLVALGFNLATTCTLSLLSKQMPPTWNGRISMAIQYSNYTGRVTGAVWGGAGVKLGMMNFVGLQIAFVGIGALLHSTLWRELKAKTG